MVSIAIALVSIRIIDSFYAAIGAQELYTLLQLARDGQSFEDYYWHTSDILIYIVKGTVGLAMKFISFLGSIYLVFKGADYILSIMGVDERSGIDVKEHVGGELESTKFAKAGNA